MTDPIIPNSAELDSWRKSSYSGGDGGTCVEVLDGHPAGIPVRDSKAPHGPAITMSTGSWATFISAVRTDAYDKREAHVE